MAFDAIPESSVTNLLTDLATIVATTVHLAGAESITGIKTFTANPVFNDGGIPQAKVAGLVSALAAAALDSTVVHKTGDESIAGVKTFSSAPVVPSASFPESAITNLTTDLGLKALDSAVVHLAGSEAITGAKTFSTNPVFNDAAIPEAKVANLVSDLSTLTSAVALKAADNAVVHLAGSESITGAKTFSTNPVFNDAAIPEAKVASLVTDLAAKATDTLVEHLAGTETVTGDKTHSGANLFSGATRFTGGKPWVDMGAPSGGDDTVALQAKVTALANGSILRGEPGAIYRVNELTFANLSNITIDLNGATLKKIDNAPSVFDDWGSTMIRLIACKHVLITGGVFDGNYLNQASNIGQNHAITIFPAAAMYPHLRDNNFGEVKPSHHITVRGCEFYHTGAHASDHSGDGVYAFAADFVTVEDCYFEDMGRWAAAFSDCFNVLAQNNVINNAFGGSYGIALGAFDFEDESSDTSNGTYARNLTVRDNRFIGRALLSFISAHATYNAGGSLHYMRGVRVLDNTFDEVYYSGGTTAISLICYNYDDTTPVELSDVQIIGNRIFCTSATPLTYGIDVYANGPTTNLVRDIVISDNYVYNATNGIQLSSGGPPVYVRVKIRRNTLIAGYNATGGIGINSVARNHSGLEVCDNHVTDFAAASIFVQDNTGAMDAIVNFNKCMAGLATTFSDAGLHLTQQVDECIGNIAKGGGTSHTFGAGPLKTSLNSWD